MANTSVNTDAQYTASMHYVTEQWTLGSLAGLPWPPPIRQAPPVA
jgi:hypothetical protein